MPVKIRHQEIYAKSALSTRPGTYTTPAHQLKPKSPGIYNYQRHATLLNQTVFLVASFLRRRGVSFAHARGQILKYVLYVPVLLRRRFVHGVAPTGSIFLNSLARDLAFSVL